MQFINLDKTKSYKKLRKLATGFHKAFNLADVFNVTRVRGYDVPIAAGLPSNGAAKPVNDEVVSALQELANEQELIAKYRAMLDGAVMNTGENRKVLHHLTRGQLGLPVIDDGKDLGDFYRAECDRFCNFANRVHNGEIAGSTNKPFTTVVQIGIGGSDLGPRALYIALQNWAKKEGREKLQARFISNVDPDDAAAVIASCNLEQTLFILVSKSGTTQETLSNETFARSRLAAAGLNPARHIVAVTSETSPLAHNANYLDSFYMDDYIGGRYSSTSPVGGVILSLCFGGDTFRELLAGAHEADEAALKPDILHNAAMLDALLGVWERNFLGLHATAVLPYSQALLRFTAHLQQLDMESNGKHVNRNGKRVAYKTGPIIFGEPGTNGQHSFYQWLHQGTDIVPLQFVGFRNSQLDNDVTVDNSTNQRKLTANLAAQITAFARGQSNKNLNKEFDGGRPSSLIYGERLTPATLGALLAHFENKVMFQGFVWNLNSFDQEGVQLGKHLTKTVLAGDSDDSALNEYTRLLS
jgi:glucose-6-phosphate isomerase